jgi:hypothetical protein
MTRIAKDLRERVVILMPTKVPNSVGGFNRGYSAISQIWASVIPVASAARDIAHFAAYIRGTQVSEVATHKMKCRRIAVEGVGAGFDYGFNRGFSISGNLEILRSDYYVLRLRGGAMGAFSAGFGIGYNQTIGQVGNLYQIIGGVDLDSNKELLEIRLKEIEERGTGVGNE